MGSVDRMDQNNSSYMINLRTKKWLWPLFRVCVDITVNNAFQIYREHDLQPGEVNLDLLGFRGLLLRHIFCYFVIKRLPLPCIRAIGLLKKFLSIFDLINNNTGL